MLEPKKGHYQLLVCSGCLEPFYPDDNVIALNPDPDSKDFMKLDLYHGNGGCCPIFTIRIDVLYDRLGKKDG
jgi:hypothetical protein